MDRRGIAIRYYLFRFQRVFEKVPHQRLLVQLKAHGIGDGIIDWIEQWLTDGKIACCNRCRGFKLEISFEWISIRALIIPNININDLHDNII